MQALGLIETKGLLAAVESADAMLKAADVALLERNLVGGGLVTVAVTGEVAAVKAAVDAGAAAVRQLNPGLLMSEHVIPRPHGELDDLVIAGTPYKEREKAALPAIRKPSASGRRTVTVEATAGDATAGQTPAGRAERKPELPELSGKAALDRMAEEKGVRTVLKELQQWKVVRLRALAREYKDFGITGRLVSRADKKVLLEEFKKYYGKKPS